MGMDGRMDRLMLALSARERAVLVLRSLQQSTPEDPAVRRTMPRTQAAQFNHYTYLMNACNIYLPLYITVVEQQTEQLLMRVMWLESVLGQGTAVWELGKLLLSNKQDLAEEIVSRS